MAIALEDVKISKVQRFTLAEVPGFPMEIYQNQLGVYREQERWFKGIALDDQQTSTGQRTDLYPLRINPILSTVLKHAYILFGEVTNNGKPLVFPTIIPKGDGEREKKLAQEAEDALNMVWWENSGRSLQFENGVLSQIYGGCIFKATYVPWEADGVGTGWRQVPIRIERINPKSFIGRPSAGDMFRLREGWIVSDIPLDEARRWGYKGTDDMPTYVEYWSPTDYKTWINNEEPAFFLPFPERQNPFNGANPFGFVPIVYVPHVRAGGFYGINAFDHLKGIIKELNARFADFGDAVAEDSHAPIGMRNVNGSPQLKTIANGIQVIDLGASGNITGNEAQPDLFEIQKQRASAAMKELVDQLVAQYRRDSNVPAVAEGEDEGSQRSALTLATRFWPLTSHVGIERIYFSSGMDVFNTYLLRMMAEKKIHGITEEHTKMIMKQSWAPMLPRDRQAEVQEWAARAQNNIGSVEHLIELTRDVDDIAEEREKILKWIEDVAEVQAKVESKYAPAVNTSSNPNNTKPGRIPVKPAKTIDEKVGGGGGSDA